MKKLLTTISVVSLLAITPALAQSGAPSQPPAAKPDAPAPSATSDLPPKIAPATSQGDLRATNLLNVSVKNSSGKSVGNINDLLIDKSGKVTTAIVGVGGFLGIGERSVALPFEQVQLGRDSNNRITATANVTEDSLMAMPEWKDPNAVQSSPSPSPSKSPASR